MLKYQSRFPVPMDGTFMLWHFDKTCYHQTSQTCALPLPQLGLPLLIPQFYCCRGRGIGGWSWIGGPQPGSLLQLSQSCWIRGRGPINCSNLLPFVSFSTFLRAL